MPDPRFRKVKGGWRHIPPLTEIEQTILKEFDMGMWDGVALRIEFIWGFELSHCHESWCGMFVVDDGRYRVKHKHLDDALTKLMALREQGGEPAKWEQSRMHDEVQ